MKPFVRGVILEGLSNAGKTSVLRAIKQEQAKDEENERSVVILGEHYSQQLQTIKAELQILDQKHHQDLLRQRVECIEQLNEWAVYLDPKARRRSRGLFFVFERFHLDHRIGYRNYDHIFIKALEERLSDLGAICFLLTVSPNIIGERIAYREKKNGKHTDSDTLKERCDEWLSKQEQYIQESRKSIVPTIVMNTDARNWSAYAAQILSHTDERSESKSKS